MARPSARPLDLASSTTGENGMTFRGRSPAATARAFATSSTTAATAPPSAPLPPPRTASRPSRPSRQSRTHARNLSFVSNMDTADLGSVDVSQLQVESDSSDSSFQSPRRSAAKPVNSHARSMSNPFPSFFSPKKKARVPGQPSSGYARSGSSSGGGGDDDDDDNDDDDNHNRAAPATTHYRPPHHGQPTTTTAAGGRPAAAATSHGRRQSVSTGPCITCGSMMRWARGVEAFRCSICLTVNDLVPPSGNAVDAGFFSVTGPISLEQTRALVRRSLRSYLEAVLSDVAVNSRTSSNEVPKETQGAQRTQPRAEPAATASGGQATKMPAVPPSVDSVSVDAGGAAGNHRSGQLLSRSPNPQTLDRPSHRPTMASRPPLHNRAASSSTYHTTPYSSHAQPPSHRQHRQPPPPSSAKAAAAAQNSGFSSTHPPPPAAARNQEENEAKRIFRPLEDYILSHIFSMDCLDTSFVPPSHPALSVPPAPEAPAKHRVTPTNRKEAPRHAGSFSIPELDTKTSSLFGDAAENSSWWTSVQGRIRPTRGTVHHHRQASEGGGKAGHGLPAGTAASSRASRPIYIDWPALDEWYGIILNAAAGWMDVYDELVVEGACTPQPIIMLENIEAQLLKGQEHAQRALLKAIETVLKRPGRRISVLGDFRFLIMALANPLLHASCKPFSGTFQQHDGHAPAPAPAPATRPSKPNTANRGTGPASGQHSVIIKRILGLISNSSDEWHNQMITCFAQFSTARFLQMKDLVGGFLAYRLVRYNEKKEEQTASKSDIADTLVPKVPDGASAASFHAALNPATGSASSKKPKQQNQKTLTHGDDWQIKTAVRVLGLLFAANNAAHNHRHASGYPDESRSDSGTGSRGRLRGQIVPTSDFYITLLDNCDLVADFEAWEQQRTKFAFCQYPFLLSVWAKIQILEYEARRQMKNKARDAFFDSIMTRRNFDQHLILNIRRDCLVEDSLKGVSAAIGSGTEDIKKGLRIIFNGEEGIDAGGLRKEWFLLLVREVFNPDHGMFTYDDESHYCYFNPVSFETSDQFFLVGVVLGLAIYNSTILDIALPPFAFRKLLLAAPAAAATTPASLPRPVMTYTLADLAEYRPRLARGLRQLLDYDGDVEATFCLDFTISVERYGHTDTMPLCPNGASRPVTNANRQEYVDLYIRYLLDKAVSRQFEPFKRGFFTMCGCNALGLFRPEEIELLVRGSDEPLDIASLRLAASYDNWPSRNPLENEPTVQWFWQLFEEASPADQRKLLIFITGSDRIPATGPASLSIRLICLGDDTGRFPTARTCFNTLTLYRYEAKDTLQKRLWNAVHESEGFGLK
ncbi:ubiquitin-protein ligase [Niveomyces insectorum RCEF 264]|uniref:HECT-type E3 ubiquitin transferase n=1 Tax=Niveomyces insectorum RCEF 264 TaxID=1081102 RepID=A0A167NUN3_9HYPO|nr:ubiquitin-protein ligase [Niveomyces insectorum RCEF 264]